MDLPPIILLAGAVVGLTGAVLYLMGINKKWGILLPFFGLLLFASMATPLDWKRQVVNTFWLPIQSRRSMFYLAFGLIAFPILMLRFSRVLSKPVSMSVVILILMGIYAAMLRFVHGDAADAAESILFASGTLIPLLFIPSLSMDKPSDMVSMLRVVPLVNIVWMGMCGVQFVVDPSYLVLGNQFRFVGLLGNPQHAGAMMAMFLVILLWLIMNDTTKKFKIVYICLISADLLALLWTGSRTGLGMFLIGSSAVLYTKVGRAIFVLPVAGIVSYVGLKFVINTLGFDVGLDRLTSTENTRDYAWWKLYTTGMDNFFVGAGVDGSEKSENSWLYAFASYGIGMLTLAIFFAVFAFWECVRLIRTRFWLPTRLRPYSDLVVGFTAMFLAGAVLEGYMIARVSTTIVLYIPIVMAGASIRQYARRCHESGGFDQMDDYGGEYDEGYGEYDGYGQEYAGEYAEYDQYEDYGN